MKLSNLKIESYLPDGQQFYVNTSNGWGEELLNCLQNNIRADEDIVFCVVTTRTDKITMSDLHVMSFYQFYCLSLLSDRIVIVTLRHVGVTRLHLHFVAKPYVVPLSVVSSIVHDETPKGRGYSVHQHNFTIETNVPDKKVKFGYESKYHDQLKQYIEVIKLAVYREQNEGSKTGFLDALERIAVLKSKGLISEDEYSKAKKRLLE